LESNYLLIVTTTDNRHDADNLARAMVEKRLAACAQVEGPITSTYWWQGTLENAEEWKCSFKSSAALYADLETALARIHPYETPEILAFPIVHGSRDYLSWMDDQLQQPDSC
jgi:periplasmic divalent cation tolerance protein